MKNENVTAEAIKNVLWETLQGVKDKTIKPDVGNAISKLANGIISTAKLEFEAAKFAGLQSAGLNTFLEAKGEKPKSYLSTEETLKKALDNQDVQNN
jgi:hypothetical protein